MRNSKSNKFKNYGPIPQNEYTIDNQNRNTNTAGILQYEPTPEEVAYRRRLKNRQAQHPSGRKKVRGWLRSWKVNGWRAESAALHDELTGTERYSAYIKKNSRSL